MREPHVPSLSSASLLDLYWDCVVHNHLIAFIFLPLFQPGSLEIAGVKQMFFHRQKFLAKSFPCRVDLFIKNALYFTMITLPLFLPCPGWDLSWLCYMITWGGVPQKGVRSYLILLFHEFLTPKLVCSQPPIICQNSHISLRKRHSQEVPKQA